MGLLAGDLGAAALVAMVLDACEKIVAQERTIISLCQSPGFSLDALKRIVP